MRKTAFASSTLSVMTLILGLLFMLHQIPYSNYILALSLFLLAASLIIFYTLIDVLFSVNEGDSKGFNKSWTVLPRGFLRIPVADR